MAMVLGFTLLLALSAQVPTQTENIADAAGSFTGTWIVTSAQTSLVLSVERGEEALVVWIHPGSHSCARPAWRSMPGGILIESVPRLRLWAGRHNDELRVELESVPQLDIDANEIFHDHFFVRRVGRDTLALPRDWALPEGWSEEALPEHWDETAGRSPLRE
jgi:hypothetical protein